MRVAIATILGCGVAAGLVGVTPARAEVLASGFRAGQCLDMRNGTEAILWQCHGGSNQTFTFRSGSYGQLMVGGRCLASSGQSGSGIVAVSCTGTRNQMWTVTSAGALRNEEGWCADVERGGGQGARIIAWSCTGSANQRWGLARYMSAVQAASQGVMNARAAEAARSARPGLSMNSSGVVAAGGNNVVAAGGANVVAAGGGNIIMPIAGVVAAGGLN